jgi:hypothetical protein
LFVFFFFFASRDRDREVIISFDLANWNILSNKDLVGDLPMVFLVDFFVFFFVGDLVV